MIDSGRVRLFVITLAPNYCRECSNTDFCALVERAVSRRTAEGRIRLQLFSELTARRSWRSVGRMPRSS